MEKAGEPRGGRSSRQETTDKDPDLVRAASNQRWASPKAALASPRMSSQDFTSAKERRSWKVCRLPVPEGSGRLVGHS